VFLRGELLRPQFPDDAHVFGDLSAQSLRAHRQSPPVAVAAGATAACRANGFIAILYLLEKGSKLGGKACSLIGRARIAPGFKAAAASRYRTRRIEPVS